MSWILKNKFLAALVAATVVISGALFYLGSRASTRYASFKQEFDQAVAQVGTYERLALYPDQSNLDAKTKAVADFEEAIKKLQGRFEAYVPEPREPITPQEFGNRLIATNETITKRLRDAGIRLPEVFYSGFEAYTGTLAQSAATAVLDYQLSAVDSLMEDLAGAKPAEVINFRRVPQPEELGGAFEPGPYDVARPHAFELSFLGTEASARRFLTALVDLSKRFAVIRVVRITSESTTAPKPSTNLFDAPISAAPGAAANASGAGGFFGAFGDAFAPEGEPGAPVEAAAPPPEPAAPEFAPPTEGVRSLGQVAGNEMIRVFLRFDLMEVLAGDSDEPSDEP